MTRRPLIRFAFVKTRASRVAITVVPPRLVQDAAASADAGADSGTSVPMAATTASSEIELVRDIRFLSRRVRRSYPLSTQRQR